MFSESESIIANTSHTIGGILSNQPRGTISSIVVDFNRDVLNKVFEDEMERVEKTCNNDV